jgi:major vault protein
LSEDIFQDNEEVVEGPEKMVVVPPNHYCVVRHPVFKNSAGEVVLESSGQVFIVKMTQ